jgi:hypothetical protein
MRGTGAHLLKAGSKRRRKQVDIRGQNEQHEMEELEMTEQS